MTSTILLTILSKFLHFVQRCEICGKRIRRKDRYSLKLTNPRDTAKFCRPTIVYYHNFCINSTKK